MVLGTTLVLGGARSGKSRLAEALVERSAQVSGERVTYLATAAPVPDGENVGGHLGGGDRDGGRDSDGGGVSEGGGASDGAGARDEDLATRIAAHRARRPSTWTTVELEDPDHLIAAIDDVAGILIVDSLGMWVARTPAMAVDGSVLTDALRRRDDRRACTVVVSEEVGLGVHPASDAGRRFRDVLGELNQSVGAMASEVLLVVAGRTLSLGSHSLGSDSLGSH